MNKAYPSAHFDEDIDAVKGFADLLIGGFENLEGVKGAVRVSVTDQPEMGFIAQFSDTLKILDLSEKIEINTEVEIPIPTLERIFKEFEYLDFRDPSIMGTITFSGDLGLLNHLARSCLRPSDWATKRFSDAERLHKDKGFKHIESLNKLHCPTQIEMLEEMQKEIPFIITGLEPTPPCSEWNLDKLVEKYGDAIVRVRSATQKQNMTELVEELKEFQRNPYDDMVAGFVKPYTEGAELPQEMIKDFGPLFFDDNDFIPPQLWLGAVPTHIPTSSLHRDPLTGFLLQVIGQKRLDLYSADQAELLYPLKAYNNYQPCWVKPEDVNEEVFPLYKDAKCISVTLNPGELLVQPKGWFHQVYALDSPNMSVSYFWRY